MLNGWKGRGPDDHVSDFMGAGDLRSSQTKRQNLLTYSAAESKGSMATATTVIGQRRRWARGNSLMWIAVVILTGLLLMALFPQAFTAQDPFKQDLRNRLEPPFWTPEGDWTHPLGTDHLGRDLWARIVYGTHVSVLIATGAVFVAGLLGTTLGLLAGYNGGVLDEIIMRSADIQLSFSPILLVIAVMAVVGPGLRNMIIVLGLVSWVQYARVVRGETLLTREMNYIEAAHALGLRDRRIMSRHILPNVAPSMLVIATVNASQQILNEAALSFLGLGVQPPIPAWGSMLHEGQSYFQVAWWNAVFPGLAILITVLGINLLGDQLSNRRIVDSCSMLQAAVGPSEFLQIIFKTHSHQITSGPFRLGITCDQFPEVRPMVRFDQMG